MGFVDWLSRKKGGMQQSEKIWLTSEAKSRGVVEEARSYCAKKDLVLVVAHFESTLAQIGVGLKASLHRDPVVKTLPSSLPAAQDPAPETDKLFAMLSENLKRSVIRQYPDFKRGTSVIVGERHPLREIDDALCHFVQSLPSPCNVVFHLSMDDPLMKVFGNPDGTKSLLKIAGMSADEAITGRLMSRQIERAQAKIAKQKRTNHHARSPEEWFRVNTPGFGN